MVNTYNFDVSSFGTDPKAYSRELLALVRDAFKERDYNLEVDLTKNNNDIIKVLVKCGRDQVTLIFQVKDLYLQGFVAAESGKPEKFFVERKVYNEIVKNVKLQNLYRDATGVQYNTNTFVSLPFEFLYDHLIPNIDSAIEMKSMLSKVTTLKNTKLSQNMPAVKDAIAIFIVMISEAARFKPIRLEVAKALDNNSGDNFRMGTLVSEVIALEATSTEFNLLYLIKNWGGLSKALCSNGDSLTLNLPHGHQLTLRRASLMRILGLALVSQVNCPSRAKRDAQIEHDVQQYYQPNQPNNLIDNQGPKLIGNDGGDLGAKRIASLQSFAFQGSLQLITIGVMKLLKEKMFFLKEETSLSTPEALAFSAIITERLECFLSYSLNRNIFLGNTSKRKIYDTIVQKEDLGKVLSRLVKKKYLLGLTEEDQDRVLKKMLKNLTNQLKKFGWATETNHFEKTDCFL